MLAIFFNDQINANEGIILVLMYKIDGTTFITGSLNLLETASSRLRSLQNALNRWKHIHTIAQTRSKSHEPLGTYRNGKITHVIRYCCSYMRAVLGSCGGVARHLQENVHWHKFLPTLARTTLARRFVLDRKRIFPSEYTLFRWSWIITFSRLLSQWERALSASSASYPFSDSRFIWQRKSTTCKQIKNIIECLIQSIRNGWSYSSFPLLSGYFIQS